MKNNIPSISLLIYGASASGLGLLDANHSSALLLERTAQVGREFIAAFHPGQHWEKVLLQKATRQLKEELLSRNLVATNDKVHLPPMAPVLYNFIKRRALNVELMTRIIDVQHVDSRWEVTYQNVNGLQKISAQHLIDTTSTCESYPTFQPDIHYRKLNAMLHLANSDDPAPHIDLADVELLNGRFPGEVILKLSVNANDDWITARHKMHQFWLNRPRELQPWTLAAVADCFEIGVSEGSHHIAENWEWLPSNAYENLLDAFDAGQQLTVGGDVRETLATR